LLAIFVAKIHQEEEDAYSYRSPGVNHHDARKERTSATGNSQARVSTTAEIQMDRPEPNEWGGGEER